MAAIIALPSEGKSAAYLMFNVEPRGRISGLKSNHTHGEGVYSISFLIGLSFIIVFTCVVNIMIFFVQENRLVLHVCPLQHWNTQGVSTDNEQNSTHHMMRKYKV